VSVEQDLRLPVKAQAVECFGQVRVLCERKERWRYTLERMRGLVVGGYGGPSAEMLSSGRPGHCWKKRRVSKVMSRQGRCTAQSVSGRSGAVVAGCHVVQLHYVGQYVLQVKRTVMIYDSE
jgi:hypothetical protein